MGFLLVLFLLFLELAFGSWIVVMNVNDMIAAGEASFWPVLWILAIGVLIFGTSSKA